MKILRPPQGKISLSLLATFFAIFGFTNLCLAQVAQEVVQDGAFAYWTLNETGPGAASNAGSNTGESASYPDNPQIEFGVPGIADPNSSAVRFLGFADGATDEVNGAGYLDVGNSSLSNAGGPWIEKTIELWFNADDANSDTEQVLYEQGGSTRAMSMYIRDGEVFVGAHNSAGDGGAVATPWPAGLVGAGESELAYVSTEIESNTDYHLVLVMDGDDDGFDGTITGYLNGEQFGEIDGIGALYAHTDAIRIGGPAAQTHFDPEYSGATPFGNDSGLNGDAPTDNAPYFFSGVIDDVALYNTALSADRVAAHYDAVNYLPGDFNDDGMVDMTDFLVFAEHFNKPGLYSEGDISFNGHVDLQDFSIFRQALANANAVPAASVPEPASHLMVCLAALALPMLLRRRAR